MGEERQKKNSPCYGNASSQIPKTVFSFGNQSRFWLVAGLEHTGHHLWHNGLFPRLASKNATKPLGKTFQAKKIKHERLQALLNTGWDCGNDERIIERTNATMQDMYTEMFEYENRVSTRLHNAATITFFSYPCFRWSKLYEGMNPDLVSMAKAAEKARADLRILVLTRPAIEIMHQFNTDRAEVYAASCQELTAQLKALDPRFHFCFPYHEYRNMRTNSTALHAATDFLSGRSDEKHFANHFAETVKETYRPRSNSYSNKLLDRVDKIVWQDLEECIRELDVVARCNLVEHISL